MDTTNTYFASLSIYQGQVIAIKGYTPLETVYKYDPLPAAIKNKNIPTFST